METVGRCASRSPRLGPSGCPQPKRCWRVSRLRMTNYRKWPTRRPPKPRCPPISAPAPNTARLWRVCWRAGRWRRRGSARRNDSHEQGQAMKVHLTLNGQPREFDCAPGDSLMEVLRRSGCWSVKHGCESGECGACSVIVDGRLTPTCVMLAPQVEGRSVATLESLNPDHALHPIQQAFVDTGAVQCGYCTPAMILATKVLLDKEKHPTEAQAREALSAVLCRCTGYKKPVEAVLRAAAALRGESLPPPTGPGIPFE